MCSVIPPLDAFLVDSSIEISMRLDAIIGMENTNHFTFEGSVAWMSLFTGTFYMNKEFIKKGPRKHERTQTIIS